MPLNAKYQYKWRLFLRKIAQPHKAYCKNYCIENNQKFCLKLRLKLIMSIVNVLHLLFGHFCELEGNRLHTATFTPFD